MIVVLILVEGDARTTILVVQELASGTVPQVLLFAAGLSLILGRDVFVTDVVLSHVELRLRWCGLLGSLFFGIEVKLLVVQVTTSLLLGAFVLRFLCLLLLLLLFGIIIALLRIIGTILV